MYVAAFFIDIYLIAGHIDRFEEKFAVVEIEGKTKDYPKDIFLKDTNAGDVVYITRDDVEIDKNFMTEHI